MKSLLMKSQPNPSEFLWNPFLISVSMDWFKANSETGNRGFSYDLWILKGFSGFKLSQENQSIDSEFPMNFVNGNH
jgi:hypothetical protein